MSCNVFILFLSFFTHSASLASLTRESGPKVVKGDPATKAEKGTHVHHHPQPHYFASTAFDVSDSALKFTHVLYNLSPAGNIILYILQILSSIIQLYLIK